MFLYVSTNQPALTCVNTTLIVWHTEGKTNTLLITGQTNEDKINKTSFIVRGSIMKYCIRTVSLTKEITAAGFCSGFIFLFF